jgi:uncharacterized protein
MPLDIALAAIDMVISNAIKSEIKNITIGFHGGGEPTTNWDVLTKSMIYVKNKSIEHDIKLNTYIVTNGVLSQNQVDWLGQNIISNTISIDGPPDVQNRQRPLIDGGPSYGKVAKAIDKFDLNNVPYAFRTTITDYSEDRIPEIYDHLTTRFKPTMVCIEPLFSCGRSMTSLCRPPKMKAFLDGYSTVVKKIKNGIAGIEYSGGRFHLLDSCFCGTARGNFIVTPRGDITSCVEISSREDPRADVFMYGKYNATTKKFEYQKDVYDKLFKMNVNNFISCKDCFARWHCSGDCPSKAPNMDALYTDRNTYRCEINKEIIKNQLMAKVGSL